MRARIYSIAIGEYGFPKDKIYRPLIANAGRFKRNAFPAYYLRDDTGDNITERNDLYSEFTATYWMWKNSNADIIGLNHYRRYFLRGGWLSYLFCMINPAKSYERFILRKKDLCRLWRRGYNCILPKKQWRVERTLREEYTIHHTSELLDAVERIILKDKTEYAGTFDRVMRQRENYQKCLCVLNREMFNSYVKWMFDIFRSLEDEGFSGNQREFAYLGERLMNVWFEHNKENGNLKVKELFFVNLEFSLKDYIRNHTELYLPIFLCYLFRVLKKAKLWKTDFWVKPE